MQIPGDVTDPEFVIDAVEQTVRELGALDVLVNNAAHQHDKPSLEAITDQEWDKTFQTNIYVYFRFARAALKHMREGAAIINTGSETGYVTGEVLAPMGGQTTAG